MLNYLSLLLPKLAEFVRHELTQTSHTLWDVYRQIQSTTVACLTCFQSLRGKSRVQHFKSHVNTNELSLQIAWKKWWTPHSFVCFIFLSSWASRSWVNSVIFVFENLYFYPLITVWLELSCFRGFDANCSAGVPTVRGNVPTGYKPRSIKQGAQNQVQTVGFYWLC